MIHFGRIVGWSMHLIGESKRTDSLIIQKGHYIYIYTQSMSIYIYIDIYKSVNLNSAFITTILRHSKHFTMTLTQFIIFFALAEIKQTDLKV